MDRHLLEKDTEVPAIYKLKQNSYACVLDTQISARAVFVVLNFNFLKVIYCIEHELS